jgi:DNA-binding response OmpR family regulator
MAEPEPQHWPLRFGNFEVDPRAGELRKAGMKLKLSGQPFQVLCILLERPGVVATREELQKRLWPNTFVDVDHNLNTPSTRFARCWAIRRRVRALWKRCRGVDIAS